MNLSSFIGFPFLFEGASSHPDKLRVQTSFTVEVKEELDLTADINDTIEKLRIIETPEYRAAVGKDTVEAKRRKYTLIFKTLLMAKESQNKG